ncbi:MAG: Xaa-Pro peptidase family protein [Thermoplasmata archaeon]|nr:Xaa-Pro peptidase family protein [Thermoplasmata archaeon]
MIDYKRRIAEVRKHIAEKGADAFVLKNAGNIRYLSCSHVPSFAMLTYLVVTPRRTIGITSSLEEWRAREQVEVDDIRVFAGYSGIPSDGKTAPDVLKSVLGRYGVKTLLMDSKERLHGIRVTGDDLVERLREVKDDHEIRQIRAAVRMTKRVERMLADIVVPGRTENQAAADIEHALRAEGGTAISFTCIVASGRYHSAYSHHDVTTRRIGKADAVVVDFGCYVNGYCSDITRTLLMKDAPQRLHDIYDLVERAQKVGISAVKVGRPFRDVEAAIREELKPDYDRYFVHSTGHGFGLEVHERPWVRMTAPETDVVRRGQTFTIEPGVYIPGVGGVRIEDDIFVGDRARVL